MYTASRFGILSSEDIEGCSADWPCRNWLAEEDRIKRMEMSWCERASIIRGILMVATEPVHASSTCGRPSF